MCGIVADPYAAMTVYRSLSPEQRPAWSEVTGAGTFSVGRDGRFDRHYHDGHEYWMIYQGSALILVGDREYMVSAGDIVCIEKDTDHDVLEVYEPLEGFWFEDATPPGGQAGHLHRTPADRRGHPVPGRSGPPPGFVQGRAAT